jgi:tRNA dimethylallyltransferase
MSTRPVILAIVGPTASGKTPLAVEVAERLKGEIVSADSRQVYRFLDIGTAKPTPAERRRVIHHFIDIRDPNDEYSAGAFGQDARKLISERLSAGVPVVIVGGSGLYLRAVIDGLFAGPAKDPEFRSVLEDRAKKEGGAVLLEELRRVDPAAAQSMDATKVRRIIRALEVHSITGRPISELHTAQNDPAPFDVVQVALRWPKAELHDRINRRVEEMLSAGLVEEVRSLRVRGYGRHLNSLNTVGYKEVFDVLDGILPESELAGTVQRNTRRYAKRQMTWFRADTRIHWLNVSGRMDVQSLVEAFRSLLLSRRAE